MQATPLLLSLGLLGALVASPALATERDHGHHDRHDHHGHQRSHGEHRAAQAGPEDEAGQGMRELPNAAAQGEPSHGWQYFSDPAARRAVVISPQGDYYLSRGKGLRWVAAAPKAI